MSPRLGALGFLPAALLIRIAPVAAQRPGDRFETVAAPELRTLAFGGLPNLKRLRQFAVPAGWSLAFSRVTIDLSSAFASTELLRSDGTRHTVSHLTDTQLRGAYTIGRDALLLTVMLNLPTGLRNGSVRDYAVAGAISPSLLGFPVASYANGFSVTAGAAAAIPAGRWSLGIAGSVRASSRYTPYVDDAGPITYKPGFEARLRAGADGLLGSSRASLGLTYSTFGDDQFGSGGTVQGIYRPGPRLLAEALLVAPLGGSQLNLSFWGFRRSAGDSTSASAQNRETLGAGEVSLTLPLSRMVSFVPAVSGRLSKPETGNGELLGLGGGIRIRLADGVSLTPSARYETGRIKDGRGSSSDLRGSQFSAFFRATF